MKLSNKQLGEVVDELQHEMRCLIHKETGKIEILFGHDSLLYMDLETFEADQNRIKEPEKYIEIEKMPSHIAFKVMEQFVDTISDENIQRKLIDALNRRKPFSNFKYEIRAYEKIRENWFDYLKIEYIKYIKEFLAFDFEFEEE